MIGLFITATTTIVQEEVHKHVVKGINFVDRIREFIEQNLINMLAGVLVFVIGCYIASLLRHTIKAFLSRSHYDQTVVTFLSQLIYYSVIFIAAISALSLWGVPSTSFVAMIGGFGIAVGLALQSNMANFASGLLLLIFKPFRVGDWVQLSGFHDVVGTIDRIELLYTAIVNKERRVIFVPNSKMTSNAIINSSFQNTRYLRFDVGISYGNDHHKAIEILKGIFHDSEHILNHDNVEIGITSFGENSVVISAFPEVEKEHTLHTFYWVMSEIKDRFDAHAISMPFPQRDLHIKYQVEDPVNAMGQVPVKVQGMVVNGPTHFDRVPNLEEGEEIR